MMKRGIPFLEWEKGLQKGELPSVVAFLGPELFFFEAGMVRLSAIVEEEEGRVEPGIHWAGETDTAELLSDLNTCPLAAGRRIVGIRRLERSNKRDMKKWAAYCAEPAEWNLLVLQITSSKPLTKDLEKAIEKGTQIVDSSAVKAKEMPSWAAKGLKSRGKSGSKEVHAALAAGADGDLIRLRNELEKISLYLGDRKKVVMEDVETIGSALHDASTFALGDAIAEGNLARSLQLANKIVLAGESPAALLASITWHTRRLATIQDLSSRGATPQEVAEATRIPSFFVDKAIRQAKGLSREEVRRRLKTLGEWDFRFKRSLVPESATVEKLIHDLLTETTEETAGSYFL